VLLVVAIVFFGTSHPRRGIVLIILTIVAAVGAWLTSRSSRPAA